MSIFKQRTLVHRELPQRFVKNAVEEAQAKQDGFVEQSAYSPSWPSTKFPVTRYHPTECAEDGTVPSVQCFNEADLEEHASWVDSPATARNAANPEPVEEKAPASNKRPCPECGKGIPLAGAGRAAHMRTHEKVPA